MTLPFLDRLGNWNPQLYRELKGRLKPRNLAIAGAISLFGQFLLLMSFIRQIPSTYYNIVGEYCKRRDAYLPYQEQYNQLGSKLWNYSEKQKLQPAQIKELETKINELQKLINENCPQNAINVPLWWHDHWPKIFIWLSLFGLFILLTVGAYMLISDLANEERRGTLNFIRLSPQSSQSIFVGKILGVPILLYFAAIVAVPFHLWAGISAQIPLVEIFSFYAVVIGSCAFFYSAALLFGLTNSWLGGFQSWLGGGAALALLTVAHSKYIDYNSSDWLNLFNPSIVLPYLIDRASDSYAGIPVNNGGIYGLQWFFLSLGGKGISIAIFALLNYGFWTYWIGEALSRRFRSEQATLLSKRQSYLLVACFEVVNLGFALQKYPKVESSPDSPNLIPLLLLNGALFLGAIAALSPHRQVLQDWARYKEGIREKGEGRRKNWSFLMQDLIWGEKSPAIVAIAINIAIVNAPLVCCILLWPDASKDRMKDLLLLLFSQSFLLICASVVQLILLMKTPKRALWAVVTVVSAIALPPFILSVLSINPGENGGGLWLLTAFPSEAVKYASATLIFQVVFIQWTLFGVLNWQFTRQLQRAGESASKALLSGSNSQYSEPK